jgi:hypothetical protein
MAARRLGAAGAAFRQQSRNRHTQRETDTPNKTEMPTRPLGLVRVVPCSAGVFAIESIKGGGHSKTTHTKHLTTSSSTHAPFVFPISNTQHNTGGRPLLLCSLLALPHPTRSDSAARIPPTQWRRRRTTTTATWAAGSGLRAAAAWEAPTATTSSGRARWRPPLSRGPHRRPCHHHRRHHHHHHRHGGTRSHTWTITQARPRAQTRRAHSPIQSQCHQPQQHHNSAPRPRPPPTTIPPLLLPLLLLLLLPLLLRMPPHHHHHHHHRRRRRLPPCGSSGSSSWTPT